MNQPTNGFPQQPMAQPMAQPIDNTTRNGLAQPVDPMSSNINVFEQLDAMNNPNQQQAMPNVNQQGMPVGTQQFAMPPTQAPATTTPEGQSPMDKWYQPADNVPIDPSQAAVAQPAPPAATPADAPVAFESLFNRIKAEEVQGIMKNQNFVGELFTPELQTAFEGGDFSGLPDMINQAIQQGAVTSTLMNSKIAGKGMDGMFENFRNATMPTLLNEHQTKTMWNAPEFADFSSPAMQPMVQMATAHVKGMYPTASPQQIQQHALAMMQDMSKSMATMNYSTPQQQQVATQQQQSQVDSQTDLERLFQHS